MGILESPSLRVGISVEVKLLTVGSSPDPAKAGSTLGGGVIVFRIWRHLFLCIVEAPGNHSEYFRVTYDEAEKR